MRCLSRGVARLLGRSDSRSARPVELARYEAIYRNSMDGVLFTIPKGRVLAANPAACAILRMSEAEIIAAGRDGLLVADDPRTVAAIGERAKYGRVRAELPMRRGDGTTITVDLTSAMFVLPGGGTRSCVIFRDVSAMVDQRERLARQAEMLEQLSGRDPLTDLRNRRGFAPAAAQVLDIASREGAEVQLAFFDLDQLKLVNDTRGHAMGDEVLCRFAKALAAETRDADVSARIGGDEFVLLLFSTTRAGAELAVERITEVFESTAGEGGGTFSVGIASRSPDSDETLEELVERADRRMYEAKSGHRSGRGN